MAYRHKSLSLWILGIACFGFSYGCNYHKSLTVNEVDSAQLLSSAQLNFENVYVKVIEPKCVSCHGSDGGVNLESYDSVRASLLRVQTTVVDGRMPKAPKEPLTTEERDLFLAWIQVGAPQFSPGTVPVSAPTPVPTASAPTPGGEAIPVRFADIYEKIFVAKCLDCHGKGDEAEDVPLDRIEDLIDPPNGQLPFAIPGEPHKSRLWIITDPNRRSRMPPASKPQYPPLTVEERKAIEDWIRNGAVD